jgi:hypothetical protein
MTHTFIVRFLHSSSFFDCQLSSMVGVIGIKAPAPRGRRPKPGSPDSEARRSVASAARAARRQRAAAGKSRPTGRPSGQSTPRRLRLLDDGTLASATAVDQCQQQCTSTAVATASPISTDASASAQPDSAQQPAALPPSPPSSRSTRSCNTVRCMICLDDSNSDKLKYMSCCGAACHKRCLDTWRRSNDSGSTVTGPSPQGRPLRKQLKTTKACPHCRRPVASSREMTE